MNTLIALSLSTLTTLVGFQSADVTKESIKDPGNQTIVLLRYSKPEELAKNLQKVFGTSVIIQPTSGTPVTGLLLSGSSQGVEKAKMIIETLDQAPRMIPVEVILVEYTGNTLISTESPGKWESDIQKLKADGKLLFQRKMDLPLIENQQSRIMTGENRPMPTSATVARNGGPVQRSFSYNSLGTTVTAKGRFEGDNQIVIDLMVEDSRVVPENAKPTDKPEDFQPTSLGKLTFDNPVKLKKGQIVKVQGIHEDAKNNGRQIAVYLLAK